MSRQWRIFVLEDDDTLHRHIMNALRKDGYVVHGTTQKREAVRMLWAEEHDVVVCDLKSSPNDDIELLQWLRAYRPQARVIFVGEAGEQARAFALESGAASYLERPLDLYRLKEELHRLLSQTGFSASLDSFDLLDVIQIISSSRKNIALLVNTGLEERGMLCFQEGNLVWAEYGMLRGEEAFFALAAHKNGTVIHQPWNQRVIPNVTQPLSRLILQALTYRAKYAQQMSGEQEAIRPDYAEPVVQSNERSSAYEVDDTPFLVALEEMPHNGAANLSYNSSNQSLSALPVQSFPQETMANGALGSGSQATFHDTTPEPQVQSSISKEWWQQTGKMTTQPAQTGQARQTGYVPPQTPEQIASETSATSENENASLHTTSSRSSRTTIPVTPIFEMPLSDSSGMRRVPPGMRKTHMRAGSGNSGSLNQPESTGGRREVDSASKEQTDPGLPSWLTDQPTATELPAMPPSASSTARTQHATSRSVPQSDSNVMPQVPPTPVVRPRPGRVADSIPSPQFPQVPPTPTIKTAIWQPDGEVREDAEVQAKQQTEMSAKTQTGQQQTIRHTSGAEWRGATTPTQSGPLPNITASRLARLTVTGANERIRVNGNGIESTNGTNGVNGSSGKQHAIKRSYNYTSIVSSLQTLGFSVTGFIAAAVVMLNGQPVAQVAVDDLDISALCHDLSKIMRTMLQVLQHGQLGDYEDTVISSGERYIILRVIRDRGEDEEIRQRAPEAFQVLVTTRNTDTIESIGMMANVEGAIATALHMSAEA